MAHHSLEPIEQNALKVGEDECNFRFLVGEIVWTRRQVHGALEDECVVFAGVGAVEYIRHAVLGGGFGLLGLWEQRNVVSQKLERMRERLIRELRCGLSWIWFVIWFRIVIRVVDFRRRKFFRGENFFGRITVVVWLIISRELDGMNGGRERREIGRTSGS